MAYRDACILGFQEMYSVGRKNNQISVFERITPKQTRAFQTRDVIFEAAARIIEEQGAGALTTNSIAARAGISIGTLYGHFANKDAILVSMARRQLACDEEAILCTLSWQLEPGTSRVRAVIRSLIDLHVTRPKVRRAVMRSHTAYGLAHESQAVVLRATERIISWRAAAGRPHMDSMAMFLATRGVVGLLRAAFEEASPLLGMVRFEDELTALAKGCFARARR